MVIVNDLWSSLMTTGESIGNPQMVLHPPEEHLLTGSGLPAFFAKKENMKVDFPPEKSVSMAYQKVCYLLNMKNTIHSSMV